jgi:hypothetical protein
LFQIKAPAHNERHEMTNLGTAEMAARVLPEE